MHVLLVAAPQCITPDEAEHNNREQHDEQHRCRADAEDKQRTDDDDEERDRHQFAPQEPGKVRVRLPVMIGGWVGWASWFHAVRSFFLKDGRTRKAYRKGYAMRALSPRTTMDDREASPPGNDTIDCALRR